jgi:hypothetical protein
MTGIFFLALMGIQRKPSMSNTEAIPIVVEKSPGQRRQKNDGGAKRKTGSYWG